MFARSVATRSISCSLTDMPLSAAYIPPAISCPPDCRVASARRGVGGLRRLRLARQRQPEAHFAFRHALTRGDLARTAAASRRPAHARLQSGLLHGLLDTGTREVLDLVERRLQS